MNQSHRERNRKHAIQSRRRKRQHTDLLEDSIKDLKAENERLSNLLGLSSSHSSTNSAVSSESFLAALQDPQNRIVDDDTLSLLRENFHTPTNYNGTY